MTTRRDFLKTMSLASAGLALGSGELLNAQTISSKKGRNEKVKIAYIGIGNRGEQIIQDFARTGMVEVVALCDVDMGAKHTRKVMGMYPKAKQFRDFRQMFDKAGNEFDAVAIATPDHSHFPISMLALASGKHVYVEKPLARTFYEAELLMQAALKRPNLATQVGNQGHSEANYFQFKAWMDAGIIKDVTAVTAHMNNPRRWHKWDTNIYKLPSGQQLPKDLDWNTWLGAVPYHEYCNKYDQGEWRCWYDFGMGALGDWGAHILDTVHEFLELGLPYEVTLTHQEGHNDYFFPYSSTILFRFPQRIILAAPSIQGNLTFIFGISRRNDQCLLWVHRPYQKGDQFCRPIPHDDILAIRPCIPCNRFPQSRIVPIWISPDRIHMLR